MKFYSETNNNEIKLYYKFLLISAYMLSFSVSLSLGVDNIAIGIGLAGLLLMIKEFRLKKFDLLILGMQFIGIVSAAFSINFLYSIKKSRFLWHFLPYFITSRIKKDTIPHLINVLGFFSIISSLGAIFNAFTGVRPTHIFTNFHFLSYPIRPNGFFHNPFTITGILTVIFFLFLGLTLFYKKNRKQYFSFFLYITVCILSFISIVLARCRSYWIGIFISIFILPFFVNKSSKRKIAIFISLFLIVFSISLYNFVPLAHNRIQTIIHYNRDTSAEIRLMLWKSGIELYRDYSIKNKLIGCGNDHLFHFSKNYIIKNSKEKFGYVNDHFMKHSMHNLYLQILLQWGAIGLFFWIFLWIYIIHENLIFIKKTDNDFYRGLIIGLTAGYIAFLIGALFEYNIHDSEIAIFVTYILGINQSIIE